MKIIIFSRSGELYSTRSLYNAARQRKHYVRVVDHMYCDLLVSDTGNRLFFHGQEIEGYQAAIPRIGHTVTTHGAAVIRHITTIGMYSTLNAEPLMRARDKLSCLQLLAAEGIKVPKTLYSSNDMFLDDVIKEFDNYPKIVKLLSGTHGLGVLKADNKNHLNATVEMLLGLKQKILIQEFIKESAGTDIRAFVVDGEVVASMERSAQEGEFRSNLHRGATAQKIELTEEERDTALRAVKVMGLEVAGVDMLRSERGPLVLEVNASPGLEGIESVTRVNVSKKIIQLVERKVRGNERNNN